MSTESSRARWIDQYRALTAGVGLVDFSTRTQIELTGDDRAKFLHNLCTNEIRKLAAGAGCEAFLTDVKGHISAYGSVFAGPTSLVYESVPSQGETILRHLDRYLIREKVELFDRSSEWAELLISGSQAERLLAALPSADLPRERLAHTVARLGAYEVSIRRVDLAGPDGFLINCQRGDLIAVTSALRDAGAAECGPEAFEAARLEAGSPFYGQDITEKNLPQEVDRNAQAISFNKGCYLGQETVARIDALGHVNRLLCGICFSGPSVPARGEDLFAGDQNVGQVTSTAYSPRLEAPLALAYVRRGSNQIGTHLTSAAGPAEVIKLPLG